MVFLWISHGFPDFLEAPLRENPALADLRGGVFPLAVLGQILMRCTCRGPKKSTTFRGMEKTMGKMGKPWKTMGKPWF